MKYSENIEELRNLIKERREASIINHIAGANKIQIPYVAKEAFDRLSNSINDDFFEDKEVIDILKNFLVDIKLDSEKVYNHLDDLNFSLGDHYIYDNLIMRCKLDLILIKMMEAALNNHLANDKNNNMQEKGMCVIEILEKTNKKLMKLIKEFKNVQAESN